MTDYSDRSIHTNRSLDGIYPSQTDNVKDKGKQKKGSESSRVASTIINLTSRVSKSLRSIRGSKGAVGKSLPSVSNPITPRTSKSEEDKRLDNLLKERHLNNEFINRISKELGVNDPRVKILKSKITPNEQSIIKDKQLSNSKLDKSNHPQKTTNKEKEAINEERKALIDQRKSFTIKRNSILNDIRNGNKTEENLKLNNELEKKIISINNKLDELKLKDIEIDYSIAKNNKKHISPENIKNFQKYATYNNSKLESIAQKLESIADDINNHRVPSKRLTKSELNIIKEARKNHIKGQDNKFDESLKRINTYEPKYSNWLNSSNRLNRKDVWNYAGARVTQARENAIKKQS